MAVWRFGLAWEALSVAVLFTLLLGIALSDARTYIIPDEFSLGGLALGLALSFAPGGITPVRSLLGAALGLGLLWGVGYLGKLALGREAMGGGDIKMMAMVGAFLGPWGVLLTIFLGALIGTLIFAPISYRSKKLVPFGIFLAVGAAITEPFGQALLDWYVRSFLV
jgi:leader peptidase (prepilin peptidase) / N-methyltransferase